MIRCSCWVRTWAGRRCTRSRSPGVRLIRAWRLLPDRAGRDVIDLDLRGVGLSDPNLFCDEVEELQQTDPGTSTGDPDSRDALLNPVIACHDRLVADGVDLSAYNLAEMAADAEDLRQALGIASWNIETIGTSSAVAFELLRTAPDGVRSVTMDSLAPAQLDIFTTASPALDRHGEPRPGLPPGCGLQRGLPGCPRDLRGRAPPGARLTERRDRPMGNAAVGDAALCASDRCNGIGRAVHHPSGHLCGDGPRRAPRDHPR